MTADPLHLVVLEGNAPWVRSVFAAMPAGIRVSWLRTAGPAAAARPGRLAAAARWRPVRPGVRERTLFVPGWRRLPWLTERLAAAAVGRAADERAVVVYTLPQFAGVAERLSGRPAVYFAYDPYASYDGWEAAAVAAGERRLLACCRAAFAVSPALAADLRPLTDWPVFVQPNGLPEEAIVDAPRPPRPADLPAGPVAVCIGQIGSAYDWPLLDAVTRLLPGVRFVFVGPRHAMPADAAAAADRVFARPNVTALGFRDPTALPGYSRHADVLISPLAVTPAADRRSLLRMYDYLAAGRPVVATPVASAAEHGRFCRLAANPDGFAAALAAAAAAGCPPAEVAARRTYLAVHTWPRRAELFLRNLAAAIPEVVPARHAA